MKIARLFISAALIFYIVPPSLARSKEASGGKGGYYHRRSISKRFPQTANSRDDIKAIILQEAREQLKKYFSPDSCRIRLAPRWIPSQLLQLKAENITGVEIKGGVRHYTNFEVLYNQNHHIRRAEIQLALDVRKKVPVTVQRLPAGSTLTDKDISYQWVSIFQYNGALVEDLDELQGKVLKRTLLSGQPIRSSYISREYLVKAGDSVEMYVKRKGFVVRISAEARENGAKGDEIRIYNKDTRRKYVAEVVRHGVVIWKKTL